MPSSIIEEPLYKEQIEALRVDGRRLDDAFQEVEHAILAVPDIFPQVPGTKLRRVQLVGFNTIAKGCTYCGELNQIQMSLDRKDNFLPHVKSNCLPACRRCNYFRRDMPF